MQRMLRIVCVAAAAASWLAITEASQKPLASDLLECEDPPYTVSIVSRSPLVLYLHNFLTEKERTHLQEVTKGLFIHSGVAGAKGESTIKSIRDSQSTSVPRDNTVRCLEQRALHFQGHDIPASHVEPLQLVKYTIGEQYRFHTDWFTNPAHTTYSQGGNRISSFFAYVRVSNDTTGGGTNFPVLDAPRDERWCEVVDCDEPWENGVTFRPVEGNAVYWENVLPVSGVGDERTLHAGLPVVTGEKIGMNIWTRQAPLGEDIRGKD